MAEIRDEQLVDNYRESGGIRHFNELGRRYIGKVRAMIYPMVLNDADADDLTQEVFLRVVNNISGFRKKARFSTWLYRIAVNTTNSFLRKKIRNAAAHYEKPPERSVASPGPSEDAVASETDLEIQKALASLSPSLRSAITLTSIHGMRVKEAAKADGCLIGTMYWRVHEARRMLKEKLKKNLTADHADPPSRKRYGETCERG